MIITSSARKNLKLQKWVALVSVLLLAAKFLAYWYTGSVAILTDALESIVNVAAGFIGLYSLYVAAKPRDTDHPYGHGKIEFLSAAVEGGMIVFAGAVILYKAVMNLVSPVALRSLDLGMWLIGGTAVVNFTLGLLCIRAGHRSGSPALVASGRHLQSDTYSTLAILIGVLLILLTGRNWIDSVVALLFAVFIMVTGYRIFRRSVAGIMDEADLKLLARMVAVLNSTRVRNWVDLHNLRVIKYGSVLHVDCHLTVPWYFNVNEAHAEIDALAGIIRRDFGESLELFVHTDGCLYSQCPICFKDDCPVRQHPFRERIQWTLENASTNKKHGT
ncbi:MAG TPA: cation diffusion facilitator family transporter [Chitinophagaceae bacterium]|nr:cation diffusion facilitator family transporter [Chitinophagaceae bacterium]